MPANRWALLCVVLAFALVHPVTAAPMPGANELAAYFEPFAATNNLSGSVLVTRGDTVLFAKSYGFANRETHVQNRANTRFHIASISILFTSTAVLRLIDQGKLSFDTHVSDIVPGIPNGEKITIRELLKQNSGLPDAEDDLPDSDDLVKSHQSPESLVDHIKALPPHAEPGGESRREEHSGQNLLALIIERKTGLSFAAAMAALVFDPFGLRDSGIDDDGPIEGPVARGYQLAGTFGLRPAPRFHWSAKAGNGSAYTTAADLSRWLRLSRRGDLLSDSSRNAMYGTTDACGWWTVVSKRLGERVYGVGGRTTGVSSFMEHVPGSDITIVVLTNIEHDANPVIVPEAAAMLLGKRYQAFHYKPVPRAVVGHPSGSFVFGKDFYRPSATLRVVSDANGVTLIWPQRNAPLLPIGKDRFIDRFYWTEATIIRGTDGEPIALDFGTFRGTSTTSK
jgi:CubicO group peptidase (beta-lactamase class C family)